MSLLPTCTVCDALLRTSGTTRCDRCAEPCPACDGDVAHCRHPLAVPYTRFSFKTLGNGRAQVAA